MCATVCDVVVDVASVSVARVGFCVRRVVLARPTSTTIVGVASIRTVACRCVCCFPFSFGLLLGCVYPCYVTCVHVSRRCHSVCLATVGRRTVPFISTWRKITRNSRMIANPACNRSSTKTSEHHFRLVCPIYGSMAVSANFFEGAFSDASCIRVRLDSKKKIKKQSGLKSERRFKFKLTVGNSQYESSKETKLRKEALPPFVSNLYPDGHVRHFN